MFTLELLQAISDWQRGGDSRQKARRGAKLREVAQGLPAEFRACPLCCFRQLALPKDSFWKLADELELPETISAWTQVPSIARIIKGGVPPPGLQGIIFVISPPPDSVIVNLTRLYMKDEFRKAIEENKDNIVGYYDGIGRYGNTQQEIVIAISNVNVADIYELGGYSSDRDELIRTLYGPSPTAEDAADFDHRVEQAGVTLGAAWIGDEAKDRVLAKLNTVMPTLRTFKALQEMIPS